MKSSLRRVAAFLRLGALAASISTLSAQQTGNSPVKIFIMVGQSNMLGHGNMSPAGTQGTLQYVVANDPGGTYQFVADEEGAWVVRDDVWIKDQYGNASGLTAGYGSGANDANNPVGSNIGPELGFGHAMGAFYEEQILIVKAAWGGKSLNADFRPPSAVAARGGEVGPYYNAILDYTHDVLSNIDTEFPEWKGKGYRIAGIGWHQGWNDRVDKDASANYETNLVDLIKDLRAEFGNPKLPVSITTTGMAPTPEYTDVELAQLAVAILKNIPPTPATSPPPIPAPSGATPQNHRATSATTGTTMPKAPTSMAKPWAKKC